MMNDYYYDDADDDDYDYDDDDDYVYEYDDDDDDVCVVRRPFVVCITPSSPHGPQVLSPRSSRYIVRIPLEPSRTPISCATVVIRWPYPLTF